MPPSLISAVRQGRGRHLQPIRNRKKSAYPVEFKRAVCRLAEEHEIKGLRLRDKVEEVLHFRLSLSTLHDILKRRAEWSEATSLSRCRRNWTVTGLEDFEKEMVEWCHGWVRRHGTLTYACLIEKARKKADELDVQGFKGSNGWVCNFVRRNGLRMRRRCGEGGDANEASADLARYAIPRVLRELGARPEDVFNCDETGIIFGAHPERTLAPTSVKGTKRDMDRLTILFACNVTGTERLKPLMCGKMARQRAWLPVGHPRAWFPDPYVQWEKSKKAWMTKELFNRWLMGLRQEFKQAGRKLFMIMDNCSSHSMFKSDDVPPLLFVETVMHDMKVSILLYTA